MKELPAKFDLTIIGGGPGGYEAAIYAAKFKARVALIERVDIGGNRSTKLKTPGIIFLEMNYQ